MVKSSIIIYEKTNFVLPHSFTSSERDVSVNKVQKPYTHIMRKKRVCQNQNKLDSKS